MDVRFSHKCMSVGSGLNSVLVSTFTPWQSKWLICSRLVFSLSFLDLLKYYTTPEISARI